MSKELLQEILEFRKYGNCLEELYEDYRGYLVEKVLNELTVKGLANSFNRRIFNKKEIDSEDATINIMKDAIKTMQQIKYETLYGKIVPGGSTHLEIEPGKYCTKEAFKKEFAKEKFENKEDLAAESLAEKLLNAYLNNFDSQGWLILKNDDYESTKDVKIPNLIL